MVEDPEKYGKVFSLGFGIWLDHDWRKVGWNTIDLHRNHFSPDEFGQGLSGAPRTTDRYVWIYSEHPVGGHLRVGRRTFPG